MKGYTLILLCAVALGQTRQLKQQTSLSGRSCPCTDDNVAAACALFGNQDELFEHENCNQFYKCSNGQAIAYFCPDNLVYKHEERICDWPFNVECGNRPIVEVEVCPETEGDQENVEPEPQPQPQPQPQPESTPEPDNGGTCNCNPSEAPGICAADGSDGTLIANENCNQFYTCANGKPVALNCPPGLLYNAKLQVCDWAANVECGDRPIVEIETPEKEDDDEENIEPEPQPQPQPQPQPESTPEPDNGGTCNCNPGEAPGICAADGSDGTLIANENCNQFYTCANGKPVALNCPPGLLYNAKLQVCDWAANVDCGDRPIVEIETPEKEDDDEENIEPEPQPQPQPQPQPESTPEPDNGGTCNCNPGEAPGICAADGSDGTLIANENCNQFYTCANGKPVALNCPPGLLYNAKLQVCDWAANVECGDRPIVEIETPGKEDDDEENIEPEPQPQPQPQPQPESTPEPDNGGTCNCNPGEAPGICAADGSDGTLIANENCNQFYTCANGKPVALNCPPGLLYNAKLQVCDWAVNVECGDRPIVEIETPEKEADDEENIEPEPQPQPQPQPQPESTPEPDNGGTCNCNPSEAPGICAADGSDGTLIANENCNQFYTCANGKPVALNCPPGLLYNAKLQVCDWAANIECGDRPIVEIETPEKEDDDEENIEPETQPQPEPQPQPQPQPEDSNEQTGGNGDPSEAAAICAAEGSDGVLVAHENCNQFSVCNGGSPVVLDCPTNLLFNPTNQQCDWPMNVDCGDRVVPEPVVPESDNGPCLCNPRQAPSICSGAESNGKMIAHDACEKYFVCFNGLPVALSCPAGLFYEPVTRQCSMEVGCDGRTISTFSFNKHLEARRLF